MTDRIPLIAGNWKMNLTLKESETLILRIKEGITQLKGVDVLVAPPFTSLSVVKQAIGDGKILLSAQNLHWEPSGAYTGEISSGMLVEAGCSHVILGHSERRTLFRETSEMIDLKVQAAIGAHLVPIVCIGETLEEREAGRTFDVIEEQLNGSLKNFREGKGMPSSAILAYEPVWAIGTGKTATPEQAQEVHHFIRQWIVNNFGNDTANTVRILYGGSVKPENAKDLMSRPDIDGALVGGASLKADLFVPIIHFRES
jgi:triosephosphate isomerase